MACIWFQIQTWTDFKWKLYNWFHWFPEKWCRRFNQLIKYFKCNDSYVLFTSCKALSWHIQNAWYEISKLDLKGTIYINQGINVNYQQMWINQKLPAINRIWFPVTTFLLLYKGKSRSRDLFRSSIKKSWYKWKLSLTLNKC